jgi:phage tail sheath gpL-like
MSGSAQIIAFTEIPNNWKVPGNYTEVKQAINENQLAAFPARGLIMGQMLSTGTATPGTVYPLYSVKQAKALFGAGSVLAEMCGSWLKANPYTPVDVIGISDASGGVLAAGGVSITGPATAAGTLALEFASVRVPVAVNIGDTAAVVAANLFTALQLQGTGTYKTIPGMAPTYTAGASTVALKALNAGTLGNQLDIRLNAQPGDMTPPGLTVTIAPMSGGATDPSASIAAALVGITSTWYTDVAWPWTDATNMAALIAWITPRYGAMEKLDAQAYVAIDATYGTALTFLPNCKFITPLPVQNPRSPSWKTAAAVAGACCYSTAQQPALQLKTVVLPDIAAPAQADLFSLNEKQVLLEAGLSTYYTDSNGAFYLERVTTSYRFDPGNVADGGYFDLQAVKIPTRVRYDWDTFMAALYPQALLAPDGSIAAQYNANVVTPSALLAQWAGRSNLYEQYGWIQNSAATVKNSTFVINGQDGNRVDARMQIDNMGNLIVLAGSLEFISNN